MRRRLLKSTSQWEHNTRGEGKRKSNSSAVICSGSLNPVLSRNYSYARVSATYKRPRRGTSVKIKAATLSEWSKTICDQQDFLFLSRGVHHFLCHYFVLFCWDETWFGNRPVSQAFLLDKSLVACDLGCCPVMQRATSKDCKTPDTRQPVVRHAELTACLTWTIRQQVWSVSDYICPLANGKNNNSSNLVASDL